MKASMEKRDGKVLLKVEFADNAELDRLYNMLCGGPSNLYPFTNAVGNFHYNCSSHEYLGTHEEMQSLVEWLRLRDDIVGVRVHVRMTLTEAFKSLNSQMDKFDISDFRAWRSQGPDECPCGMKRDLCTYHR